MENLWEFISAIRDNDFDKTKILYKSDYINMVDEFEETALHCACTVNNVYIVRFLLNKGWNIEFEDQNKCRPLHVAILNGRTSTVDVLIKGNCLLEERNKFGYTPLDLANNYRRLDCIEILKNAITRNHLLPSMEGVTNRYIIGLGLFRRTFKYYDSKIEKYFVIEQLWKLTDNRLNELLGKRNKFTQKLIHPNIVRYYGAKKGKQFLRIFSEYLPGGSLRDLLANNGPLTEGHVGRYTQQVLGGLSFLHNNGIIHKEIRCSTILRDIRDNVKINVIWIRRPDAISMDVIGDNYDLIYGFDGRIYWTAPEIIRGERWTFSSDVWSLGATVVEMLTGHPPYSNLSGRQAMSKIVSTRNVEYKCPHRISEELQLLLDQVLFYDVGDRPSAEKLLRSDFIAQYVNATGQEIIPVEPSDDENQDIDTNQNNDRKLISIGYCKGDVIGRGGFGTVYKGYDHKNERDVAIKEVWLGSKYTTGDGVKFLENEVETYKKIPNHDRILEYYGTCQDREFMNIIMEYMPGGSIKDELEQHLLTPDIVARYSKQILEGLACIHSIGIIHKDIKCANILKDMHNNLKLCDFGLSLECIDKTCSMADLGTFHWMAPEVIRGDRFDTSADVWSFGITVLEMLTGNPPYHDTYNSWRLSRFLGSLTKYEYKCPIDIPGQLQSFLDLILQCNKNDRSNVYSLLKSEFIRLA